MNTSRGSALRFGTALTLLILVSGSAAAAELKKVTTVEGVTEYQLDNGLRVLLCPDQSRPTVTINMTVLVGSRHEGYGETGMAHLLEHMLFKGTWDQPNIPKALADRGAQFNGSTGRDATNYYETFPASDQNLEFFLRLEADRLVNSMLRKSDLVAEMPIVRNEFEAGENNPREVVLKRLEGAAYDFHNYGKDTIGNLSDIERVPIANLQAFYRKYYQPDNVVLIVAGQFNEPKALELVAKYFGAISRPERKLDATYTEEPAQDGEHTVIARRVGDGGIVWVVYHVPAGPHEDSDALEVLANILGTRPSGRLYKALVETKKATTSFSSVRRDHDPGLMFVTAEMRDPKQMDAVRDELLSIAEAVGQEGVTDDEVNRAIKQILRKRELAAVDTGDLALNLSDAAAEGDWRLYFLHRDRIKKVTADQVKAVAAKYLRRNNRTVGMFIPSEKPERVTVPATPDVKSLVENYRGDAGLSNAESFDPTPANIEARTERTAIDGIRVALLPKPTRGEQIQLRLTLHYGDENNLPGFDGATGLLPELMAHGTKKFNYQKLRDELDTLEATLVPSGSTGSLTFEIQAKRQSFPAVLELLREVLREPALSRDEFELLKRARLADLEYRRTEPTVLARNLLEHELAPYPKDDVRYVPTVAEKIQRVEETRYEQVEQLYRDYLDAQAGELSIVGDFDPKAALPILEKTFSGWKAKQPYARIVMGVPGGLKGARHKINTPDKANAGYWAGLLLPLSDGDPDYRALEMANYILGVGHLSSRLGTRLREQEGLCYSAGSSLDVSSKDSRASFTLSAIANPRNIAQVDRAMREELDRLLTDPPSLEELNDAKAGYLQSMKVRRSDDQTLASTLCSLSYAGRTMEYYTDLEQKIGMLTPEQITATLKKYVRLGALIIVSAGDFETSTRK